MSASASDSNNTQDSLAAEQAHQVPEEIKVIGLVTVPFLTHSETFPSSTALLDVVALCIANLTAAYPTVFEEPLEALDWSFSYPMLTNGDGPIGQLSRDHQFKNPVVLRFELARAPEKASLVHTMAERTRSVLRKNLVLEEKLEKLNATCPAPSPANAKMDDIVARLDALTTAFAEEKSKNADLEARMDDFNRKNADLKSKNADLEARMDDFNRKNSALTDRVDGLENENIELKAEVQRHTPVLHALHRRVVLDRAKEMLLDDCTLARQVFPNAQAAITAVRNSCSARGVTRLSGPALEMVFAPGVIRAKGNSAAHTASPNDVSLAVLGSDLPPAQQKMLGEIYKYVYDKEPSLDL